MKREFKILEAEILNQDSKENYLLIEEGEKRFYIENFNIKIKYELIEDYISIDGRYFDDHSEEITVILDAKDFYGERETSDGDGLYFVDEELANQIAEQLELELTSSNYDLYWMAAEHFNND
jgi:hypothetical protein